MCGGAWESLTGAKNAFANRGSSTGRYGCCPPGSFMSNPEQNPFDAGTSCSVCPANQFATTSNNDDLSCCAVVAGGTCTACNSAVADGCIDVACIAGKASVDNDATNGCELSCAAVTNGICTACTSADASGCTAVTCDADFFNVDNDVTNGCELESLPNGDGSYGGPGNGYCGTGLSKVICDWLAGGTLKQVVVAKYGEIENWYTSEITNLDAVFARKSTFNADISKWIVSKVTTMESSKSTLANC